MRSRNLRKRRSAIFHHSSLSLVVSSLSIGNILRYCCDWQRKEDIRTTLANSVLNTAKGAMREDNDDYDFANGSDYDTNAT
jgi:hypothetical protein